MGQSLAPAPFPAPPGLPHTQAHPLTQTIYRASTSDKGLRVHAQRAEGQRTELATHVIGSGMHTQSYLWTDTRGAHRVLPLTWYSQAKRWDFTPGYTAAGHPDFARPIKAECLYCHGNIATPTGADDGRYAQPIQAIGCSRCHGDGRAHVAGRMRGEATPILNPSALPRDRQLAVCETCHLQGKVRVLRPGRAWHDVAPGQPRGAVVATFVRQTPDQVTIASHGARLARSACNEGGQPLTCTTCHAPHPTQKRDRSAACQDCHRATPQTTCTGANTPDCVGCHMQTAGTADIPHVSITDHFIQRTPTPAPSSATATGPLVRLTPTTVDPAEAKVLRARAYAEALRVTGAAADREAAEAAFAEAFSEAFSEAGALTDPWALFDRASVALIAGRIGPARADLEAAFARAPDPRIALSLADLRLRTGAVGAASEALKIAGPSDRADRLRVAILAAHEDPKAVRMARQHATDRPLDADAQLSLGLALQAARDLAGAHAAFTRATSLRPDQPLGWINRARIALMRGDTKDALHATNRPGMHGLRVRALSAAGQWDAAAKIQPPARLDGHWQIHRLRAALHQGDLKAAEQALNAAAEALPTDPQVWLLAAELLTRRGDAPNATRARQQAKRLRTP